MTALCPCISYHFLAIFIIEKGKSFESWRRKATDLRNTGSKIAGLPNERMVNVFALPPFLAD